MLSDDTQDELYRKANNSLKKTLGWTLTGFGMTTYGLLTEKPWSETITGAGLLIAVVSAWKLIRTAHHVGKGVKAPKT